MNYTFISQTPTLHPYFAVPKLCKSPLNLDIIEVTLYEFQTHDLFEDDMRNLKAITGCSILLMAFLFSGCATSGGAVAGNEGGSTPINKDEELVYKQAIVRCYKTGGTRVVKIMGKLRCY
jgi:hypothetical protein